MPGSEPAPVVRTQRLELVALSLPLLDAVLAGDLATAARLAPFPVEAQTFAGDTYVLTLRQEQLRVDPTAQPWLLRAAVHRTDGTVVGKVGFHAPPDAAGTVEVGYRVAPDRRRQGYATEMTTGLLAWARGQGVRRCLASTGPANVASQALIGRLGFRRTGEQQDEIDGLEWVYTLDLHPGPGRSRTR